MRRPRAFGARSSIAAVMGLALACSALALTATTASAEEAAPSSESSSSAPASSEVSAPAESAASPEAGPSEDVDKPEMTMGDLDVRGFARCHQVGGANDGTWDITMTVKNVSDDKTSRNGEVTASVNKTLINDDYADVAPPIVLPSGKETEFTKNVSEIKDRTIGARAIFSHGDDSRFMDSLGEWTYRELKMEDYSCPVTKVALTCSAGLTVDLSGFATREYGSDSDRRRTTTVEVMIDDVMVDDLPTGGVVEGGTWSYSSGALNPDVAHTATVVVMRGDDEYFRQALSLSVCTPTVVPGPGTTTTVTVPGPTVSATATVTATPSPAVAPSETATPVITPEPATSPTAMPVVITPEAATAPTAVNAGDGSSAPQSGLPLWAMALAAVAAIGAAGASVRLATKKN
jgi:hypothetical protein